MEVPEPEKILNPIFLCVRSLGGSIFGADLSALGSEDDALSFLNLNREVARFIQLRDFDGSLSSEERSLLFFAR